MVKNINIKLQPGDILKTNKIFKIYEPGFTLVEILVTVTIFSVVILTLFSSLRLFLTSTDIIKKEVLQIEKITTSFKQITTDIQMIFIAHPPIYLKPEFDSEPDQYRLEGQDSELSFASLSHANYNNDLIESVVKIIYYLRPNDNNVFDLCRKQILQPYSDIEKSCSDPVLVSDVLSFEISYVDHEGETNDSWDSESSEFEYQFPAAVNFMIKFYNGDKEDKENKIETLVSLPVKRMPVQ